MLKIAAAGLIPDRIIDKPKVGFFNRSVEDGYARRPRARSPTTCSTREPAVHELVDRAALDRSSAPIATTAEHTSFSRC